MATANFKLRNVTNFLSILVIFSLILYERFDQPNLVSFVGTKET